MELKNLLNATQSAEYLGLKHRTQFFPVMDKYKLEEVAKFGNVKLYAKSDLKKVRKKMNETVGN